MSHTTFSARLRQEVNVEALGPELRAVVTQAMRPESVSLGLGPRVSPVVDRPDPGGDR